MGSQRFLGEEGGLFCARTSEGLSSWPFPFMRGHVANAATALVAAPAKIRKSTNDILRARFAGAPNADAPPWSAELWQPAPSAPSVCLESWRQWQAPDPLTYDYEAEAKRRGEEHIRAQAAKGWR